VTDRRRNALILLLVAGLLAGSLVAIFTKPTRLGLDLRGGVELVYQAQPNPGTTLGPESITRAIDVMRERVDQLGVAEPEIQQFGEDQISVALPGVPDAERAREQVGQTAQLYFYDWEANVIGPNGEPEPQNLEVTGGPSAGNPGAGSLSFFDAVERAANAEGERDGDNTHAGLFYLVDTRRDVVVAGPESTEADVREPGARLPGVQAPRDEDDLRVREVPAGIILVEAQQADGATRDLEGNDAQWYVLRDDPALDGDEVRNPEQQFDPQTQAPNVTFEFTREGRDAWREVTREIAQRGQGAQGVLGPTVQEAAQHFAIVLDDELISVPFIDYVQNPNGIDAANGSQIEGGFTIETAQELANLLQTGALPVSLELVSSSQVSATLGQQSLDQGVVAGLAGLAIVALFLLVFYRFLGVIAVLALAIYSVYLIALIKLVPITLTLPGIAGLILTIGVAADANIVIFERVKEEIRGGRSTVAGIAAGYRKGLTAIIDANIVTVMVAFILFVLATSGVKGFALTLGLGTIVSFLTAVLATQAVLGTMGRTKLLNSRAALGAGGEGRPIRIDFMGLSKWFFSASGVILLICALRLGGRASTWASTSSRAPASRGRDARTRTSTAPPIASRPARRPRSSASRARRRENAFQISSETLRPTVDRVERARRGVRARGAPNTQSIGPTFGETVANAIIAIIASLL
jgi:SecD/SecF fusion protein